MELKHRSLSLLLAASSMVWLTSAGNLEKRQNPTATPSTAIASVTSSLTSSSSSSSPSSPSSASGTPAASSALLVTTISGTPTTIEVPLPTPTNATTGTQQSASSTSASAPQASPPFAPSTEFLTCQDRKADETPFCNPVDQQEVMVGLTYLVLWDSDRFPANSNVTIKITPSDDKTLETFSTEPMPKNQGQTAIQMQKDWLNSYSRFNLSFFLINTPEADKKPVNYDGPLVQLMNAPAQHYPPPPPTKLHKEGLLIGLPLGLGCLFVVAVGLLIGMRKHRQIGLGNIMGRRRGYGAGKSRRQRLRMGKKGPIQLQDVELSPPSQDYKDEALPPPRRDFVRERQGSLGSLVGSDDERQGNNVFRNEIERQRTGR